MKYPNRSQPNRLLNAACVVGILALASCRDSEPSPAFPGDVGENDRVLLPPPGAWHDAATNKGQAEWHPFKKIEPTAVATKSAPRGQGGAEKEAEAAPAGGVDPKIEEEIRGLLKDYNGLLADDKFTDAIDFFIKNEAASVKALIELLPDVSKKLNELASAWPEQKAALEMLAANLEPKTALKLELAKLKSANDKKAAGTLSNAPRLGMLFVDPKPAGGSTDIRFIVEGDVWSIDLPALAQVAKGADGKKLLSDLDAAIADAKANSLTLDTLQKKLPGLAAELASGGKPGGADAKDSDADKKKEEPEKNSG
ncbi:MAG: hypothetical protein HY287_17960 [Planctomycetes bacterium]|nr:hypothetical protein [Planctomycetota bacterium]MBI3836210.1 hypothetical protein [Planctomycetota bacterium]